VPQDQNGRAYDPRFGVSHWTSDAILAHPDFPLARAVYVDEVLALYGPDRVRNKLLISAARSVIFLVAICLDARYRSADRTTWPTVGALKKAVGVFGLTSPRRVDQVVSRLLQTGYLESCTVSTDGRVRLIHPTAKTLTHDQDWLIAHYKPLAYLFGEDGYRLPLDRDPNFQRVQREVASGFFMESAMVLLRNPDVLLFCARESGLLVLIEMVKQSAECGSTTIPLSLTDLGQRFAVSRVHVRELLLEAETRGLVALDRDRRQVTLNPSVFECLDRFIADGMSNHDLTHAAAIREIGAAATG